MERYCFERERIDPRRELGITLPNEMVYHGHSYERSANSRQPTKMVYVIYDRQRGYYHPMAFVLEACDAQLIVDGLNGVVNNPDAPR